MQSSVAWPTPSSMVVNTPITIPSIGEEGKVAYKADDVRPPRKSPPTPPTCTLPCDHNSWDNVRVVKKQMTLRCRECQVQWKAPVEPLWQKWRCEEFTRGNCNSDTCPFIHIFYRKQSLAERQQQHGDKIRTGVHNKPMRTQEECSKEEGRIAPKSTIPPPITIPQPKAHMAGGGVMYTVVDPFTSAMLMQPQLQTATMGMDMMKVLPTGQNVNVGLLNLAAMQQLTAMQMNAMSLPVPQVGNMSTTTSTAPTELSMSSIPSSTTDSMMTNISANSEESVEQFVEKMNKSYAAAAEEDDDLMKLPTLEEDEDIEEFTERDRSDLEGMLADLISL